MLQNTKTQTHDFIVWVALLFGLTLVGVAWLWLSGVNPAENFSPAIVLIAYTPSLAAIIVTGALKGWKAVGQLLKQIGKWRVCPWYYVIALVLPFVIIGMSHLLWRLLGHETGVWLDSASLAPGIGAIIAGSVGEEIGWRGFAQPLLQNRMNIFWASVVVGIIWATWHCWIVFAPGGHEHRWALDVGLTYARLVPTAILYGWLYNASRGSLLIVMLAHAAHNVAVDSMPVSDTAYGLALLIALGYLITAGIVTYVARRQLFSRSDFASASMR